MENSSQGAGVGTKTLTFPRLWLWIVTGGAFIASPTPDTLKHDPHSWVACRGF